MVTVPALPEIVTGGRTLAEAEAMVKEAIRLCVRVRTRRGEPISKDENYQASRPDHWRHQVPTL